MSKTISLILIVLLSGCEGCKDEVIHYFEVIGNVKYVKRRISGINHISFDKQDGGDTIKAENGWLCVTHNPGCNSWIFSSGNNGLDVFFDDAHPLPMGCKVVSFWFKQYWPENICADGRNGFLGYGTYKASATFWDAYPPYVQWENSCHGDFDNKNLEYAVSFIISMPEDTNLGEDTFNIDPIESPCLPPNFVHEHPQCIETPTVAHCSQLQTSPSTQMVLPYAGLTNNLASYAADLRINSGCTASLVSLHNTNLFNVTLVNGDKSVVLGVNTITTPDQLNTLYGVDKPPLPLTIRVIPERLSDDPANRKINISEIHEYFE